MTDFSCMFCGASLGDVENPWWDDRCWKCGNIPTKGDDWKWELYHPYEYIQEQYDETGELDF